MDKFHVGVWVGLDTLTFSSTAYYLIRSRSVLYF